MTLAAVDGVRVLGPVRTSITRATSLSKPRVSKIIHSHGAKPLLLQMLAMPVGSGSDNDES